jgi:hypothetical protein
MPLEGREQQIMKNSWISLVGNFPEVVAGYRARCKRNIASVFGLFK